MSNTITYPSEGVSILIIDEMARDGVARGVPGAAEIQVAYEPFERDIAPAFVTEGTTVRLTGAAATRVNLPPEMGLAIGQAHGDLRIANLAGEVTLDAVSGDLRLEALAGAVTVGQADGDLRAEGAADLRITGRCHGDLRFEGGGALAVAALSGDLRLTAGMEARLGRIHGNLNIEKLSGSLQVERGDGDARLSEIGGPAAVGALSGDLRASALTGGLSAQVDGDVTLSGPFAAPAVVTIQAGGDIHVSLPADADLRLAAQAHGRIRSDVPLTPAADGSPTFSAAVGQGAGRVNLTAEGDIRITQAGSAAAGASWERRGHAGGDPFAELGNLGERIRQQVTASLASAGINIDTGEMNLGRGDRKRGPAGFPPPPPPARARGAAPPPPAADEQIAILKMVEEGRITPEEADTLLKALGV